MATVFTQGTREQDIVRWEVNRNYSREVVTVPANTTVAVGSVLKATHVPLGKGEEAQAVEIALQAAETGAAETKDIVVLRRMAIVVDTYLDYGDADNVPAAVNAALKSLGILVEHGLTA